jgi:hypothetical protein
MVKKKTTTSPWKNKYVYVYLYLYGGLAAYFIVDEQSHNGYLSLAD